MGVSAEAKSTSFHVIVISKRCEIGRTGRNFVVRISGRSRELSEMAGVGSEVGGETGCGAGRSTDISIPLPLNALLPTQP